MLYTATPSWHYSGVTSIWCMLGVMETRITLRLPVELHARILDAAQGDMRSLNAEIVYLLTQALDNKPGRDWPDLPARFSL